MDERDTRAGPIEFQRCNSGGILRTNYDYVVVVIRVRFLVVVDNFGQIFTRHI